MVCELTQHPLPLKSLAWHEWKSGSRSNCICFWKLSPMPSTSQPDFGEQIAWIVSCFTSCTRELCMMWSKEISWQHTWWGLQVSNELESEQFQSAAESNAAVFLRLAGLGQSLVELGRGREGLKVELKVQLRVQWPSRCFSGLASSSVHQNGVAGTWFVSHLPSDHQSCTKNVVTEEARS